MSSLARSVVLFLILALAFTGAAVVLFRLLGRHLAEDRTASGEPRPRPWWGNPLVWLAASAVLILLGVFVGPHFLPGIVVFVPFFWVGGPRGRRGGPRENGSHG